MLGDPKPPEDHRFLHRILTCNIGDHLGKVLVPFDLLEELRVGIRIVEYLFFICFKSFSTVLDELFVVELLIDDHIRHHIQNQQVGFVRDDAVVLGKLRHLGLTHIDHGKVVELLCLCNHTVGDDRMRFHRVGTDHYHKLRFVDVVIGVGRRPLTDGRTHPLETWCVADASAVVYVR